MYSVDEDRFGENIKINVCIGIFRICFFFILYRNYLYIVTNKLLYNVFFLYIKK